MLLQSHPEILAQPLKVLGAGLAAGIAGGLAEVVVVLLYCTVSEMSAAEVARQIAATVRLDGTSATTGLTVHLTLAAALGITIMSAWSRTALNPARAAPLYTFMLLALAAVWAINFFIVLPLLSPNFVMLLPLPLTLVSKLAFGGGAAATFRELMGGTPRRATARTPGASMRRSALVQ